MIFRYCSLIFDEISLNSGLNFDFSADKIDGFVNSGSYKSQQLADHALVFMVRGIKKKYKQPVSFSFCQGATNQHELARQIKEVFIKMFIIIMSCVCINVLYYYDLDNTKSFWNWPSYCSNHVRSR